MALPLSRGWGPRGERGQAQLQDWQGPVQNEHGGPLTKQLRIPEGGWRGAWLMVPGLEEALTLVM